MNTSWRTTWTPSPTYQVCLSLSVSLPLLLGGDIVAPLLDGPSLCRHLRRHRFLVRRDHRQTIMFVCFLPSFSSRRPAAVTRSRSHYSPSLGRSPHLCPCLHGLIVCAFVEISRRDGAPKSSPTCPPEHSAHDHGHWALWLTVRREYCVVPYDEHGFPVRGQTRSYDVLYAWHLGNYARLSETSSAAIS